MKNVVVPIVIGKSQEWEVSKPSVLAYCNRYNLPLEIIKQEKYGIEPFDKFSNSVNLFEKNGIYELFDKYDRILRLDYDVIITPNCPNLFDVVPENKIGGVYEDIGITGLNRQARILKIQKYLGNVNWKGGYMNAGVVVASREHKEVFNTTIAEINGVQSIVGIITPEQDYFNYMVRKLGFEVYNLNYRFNHICYFTPNRFDSYIIHYAGSNVFDEDLQLRRIQANNNNGIWRELTALQMERDYKRLKEVISNE